MSNNNLGQPPKLANDSSTSRASSIFIAKHDGHSIAIRRNPDFAATVASVRKVFPTLQSLDPSCIHISSKLQDFGDVLIELHADIWAEVLHSLMYVEVSTGDILQQRATEPTEMPRQAEKTIPRSPSVKPKPIAVYVCDTHGNIEVLTLPVFSSSTIRQLKDLILQQNDLLPHNLLLSFQDYPTLEDHKQLHEYKIRDRSTVMLTTEFKVYLVGSGTFEIEVNIPTFASISSLKLVYLNSVEPIKDSDYPSDSDYYTRDKRIIGLVLSCGGQTLDETQKLGSFNHLAPECKIFVNEVVDSTSSRGVTVLSVMHGRPSGVLGVSPPSFQYRVFPESTTLDIKVLISNMDSGSPPRRGRRFELTGNDPRVWPAWGIVKSCSEGRYVTFIKDYCS